MRIERRIWHLVARETCFAIGEPVTGDETVDPTQSAVPAAGVAGITILDRAVGTREWPRHQEPRILEEEDRSQSANSDECEAHR
jgi:hypothetical protein